MRLTPIAKLAKLTLNLCWFLAQWYALGEISKEKPWWWLFLVVVEFRTQ